MPKDISFEFGRLRTRAGRIYCFRLGVLAMNAETAPSPKRQKWATALGVVVALCAAGWFASIGFTMVAVKTTDSGIPFFPGIITVIGLVVTLPPAIVCTSVALFLVGPRRSRLAWVSLCLFLLPVLCGVGIGVWKKL
jgi:hypothetical protein